VPLSLIRKARTFGIVATALSATLLGAEHSHRLVLSRVAYVGNSFGSTGTFPAIFSDPTITGIQGQVYLDHYIVEGDSPRAWRLWSLPITGLTTSFSSKSEGALMRSADGRFLTYMGYNGALGSEGVSNSYDPGPGANLAGNTAPLYDRMVALISADGAVGLTQEANAYSGDNPRAAITVDGTQFYMAGNSDSTIAKDGAGPGTTIGARYGTPGSTVSYQLGVYKATDRPDESAKQHVKDNNFRAIGIFGGDLYVAKGSGGNGDDGVFQVHNGTGEGLPTGPANTLTPLFSAPATDPVTGAVSPYTPFGFWFANPTTLYVADEGYANLDADGNVLPDALAGLEKWTLVDGAWKLAYTVQAGLHLTEAEQVQGYPVPTTTTGIRNITGRVNEDGTVTIFAITGQYSTISGGEPDPTKLVTVTDRLSAKTLPAEHHDRREHELDRFETLLTSRPGEVFRGVAFAPEASRDGHGKK